MGEGTLTQRYQTLLENKTIVADQKQRAVLSYFEAIYQSLCADHDKAGSHFAGLRKFFQKPSPPRGLYLWGSVGIGKTFLMALFFESLPFPEKKRMHFHQFMKAIHDALKEKVGVKDPLAQVAKQMAAPIRVLCFDEFVVDDIADAMLLGRLLQHLLAEGICLVATSNVAPSDLYRGGLQRDLFLPAIHLIETQTHVVCLDSHEDYRLHHQPKGSRFFTPLGEQAEQQLQQAFESLGSQALQSPSFIQVCGREIATLAEGDGVVWFDFLALCSIPRSQLDYLDIAERYHTVFISHVPVIQPRQRDLICNFIHLIDIFYDKKIRFFMSAAASIAALYEQGALNFEFARTASRLQEMQYCHWSSDT